MGFVKRYFESTIKSFSHRRMGYGDPFWLYSHVRTLHCSAPITLVVSSTFFDDVDLLLDQDVKKPLHRGVTMKLTLLRTCRELKILPFYEKNIENSVSAVPIALALPSERVDLKVHHYLIQNFRCQTIHR